MKQMCNKSFNHPVYAVTNFLGLESSIWNTQGWLKLPLTVRYSYQNECISNLYIRLHIYLLMFVNM